MESNTLRLRTRPAFRLAEPLTIYSGQTINVGMTELMDLFAYENLIIEGQDAEKVLQSGRLPEGNYSICLEVLDYASMQPLSLQKCSQLWVLLNEPPQTVNPVCEQIVPPSDPQNIVFQWQQMPPRVPLTDVGTTYKLFIYEVIEEQGDPKSAINNSNALQIFESEELSETSYQYSVSDPALELGKIYLYQIKAQTPDGRENFKNGGYAELCWFRYGYPEGGVITLKGPEDEKAYKLKEKVNFDWAAPDNRVENQPFTYTLKIIKFQEGEDPQEIFDEKEAWWSTTIPERFTDADEGYRFREKALGRMDYYAWKVICHSGIQKVAESEVRMFEGPPLLESFRSEGHDVKIISLENRNINSLNGVGELKIGPKKTIQLPFQNLQVSDPMNYDMWRLDKGMIKGALNDFDPIELKGSKKVNKTAYFHGDSIKLTMQGLFIGGYVTWDMPHPTNSNEKAQVKSEFKWLPYNTYELHGELLLDEQHNQFDLLDPLGFRLELDGSSSVNLNNDAFSFNLSGKILLPESLKGRYDDRLFIPFSEQEQLFTLELDQLSPENHLRLINNGNAWLSWQNVTVDLASDQSPGAQQASPAWKGIYIGQSELILENQLDQNEQFLLDDVIYKEINLDGAGNEKCWIGSTGLTFNYETTFSSGNEGQLYTFTSKLTDFKLSVLNNIFQEGYFKSDVRFPLLGEDRWYACQQPLSAGGFAKAYPLNLVDESYIFNRDKGDQEVRMVVKRAVFSDERLDMTVDLDFPSFDLKLENMRGLRLWGDNKIGFNVPSGVQALDMQKEAKLKDFIIIVDAVAAGYDQSSYGFALSAKIQLGEDISGKDGLPSVNLYSAIENRFAPVNDQTEIYQSDTYATPDPEAYAAQLAEAQAEAEQQVTASLSEISDNAKQMRESLTSNVPTYQLEDVVNAGYEEDPQTESQEEQEQVGGLRAKLNEKQRETFDEIVKAIVAELVRPATQPIEEITEEKRKELKKLVDDGLQDAEDWTGTQVSTLVLGIAQPIAESAKSGENDYSQEVISMAQDAADTITYELSTAFNKSVYDNVYLPVDSLIAYQISGRVVTHIEGTAQGLAFKLLNGEPIDGALQDVGTETVELVRSIADSVFQKLINPEALQGMVLSTAKEAVENVDVDQVAINLKNMVFDRLEAAAADQINEVASQFANDMLNAQIGIEAPLNFSAVASGDFSEVVKLDSIKVKVESNILSMTGSLGYDEEVPVYGNVWRGNVILVVKEPKPFALRGHYITGKTDSVSYWFAQISTANAEDDINGPISKKATPLDEPISLGMVHLMGASGRLYHRMSEQDDGSMVPDASMAYGAYLNFVLFDAKSAGKSLRLEVEGAMDLKENGDLKLELAGNMQMQNKDPQMETIDEAALVKGDIYILYNSAEEHFFGRATVETKGAVCANGMLLVDVRPQQWRVALGTEEEPISVIPSCIGWGGLGWLDLNETTAEIGLGLSYSIYEEESISVLGKEVGLSLDAGLAAMIMARMQYKPSIKLQEAGFIAEAWAKIAAHWTNARGKPKSVTLVDIYCRGSLYLTFDPSPTTMYGAISGRIEVIGIGKDFSMDVETTLS